MSPLPLARHECFRSTDLEETREKVRHILGPRCLKFASRDTGLDARMYSCRVRDMSVNFLGYDEASPACAAARYGRLVVLYRERFGRVLSEALRR